ncbi:MAG: DNA methyltransferase [Candidatus Cryptobacteroides sp.]
MSKDRIDAQRAILDKMESMLPTSMAPSYERWVHFQDAYKTSVQRWYPYREGYSTELVTSFIEQFNITGAVLDPFSGSGTTLLAARQAGLDSVGIEVNPISVLVSESENEVYLQEDITDLTGFIITLKGLKREKDLLTSTYPLAEKMFNEEILSALLQIHSVIDSTPNDKIKRLGLISWLSTIDEVSDVKKEGNGLKYRYRKRTKNGYIDIPKVQWENEHFPGDRFLLVVNKITDKLERALDDICYAYGRVDKKPIIINGDCLKLGELTDKKFQLTFFSPPYCNCFDYFEIHKVELWLGGFVSSQRDIKTLRETGFRSNINALDKKAITYKNDDLECLISLFESPRLWSQKIPNVVRGYFDDTHTLLKALYDQTVSGGYVGIVIGNSAYSGVIVPSDLLTAKIGQEVGFEVENIFIARHLTTSSQQKEELEPLKEYLRESIVLLKK